VYDVDPGLGIAVCRTTVTSPGLVMAAGRVVVWVPAKLPKTPVTMVTYEVLITVTDGTDDELVAEGRAV